MLLPVLLVLDARLVAVAFLAPLPLGFWGGVGGRLGVIVRLVVLALGDRVGRGVLADLAVVLGRWGCGRGLGLAPGPAAGALGLRDGVGDGGDDLCVSQLGNGRRLAVFTIDAEIEIFELMFELQIAQ